MKSGLSIISKRFSKVLTALVSIAFLVVLGFSLRFLFTPRTQQSSRPPAERPDTSSELLDTTDWKTYTSVENQFSIKYPATWTAYISQNGFLYFQLLPSDKTSDRNGLSAQISVRVVDRAVTTPLKAWMDTRLFRSSNVIKTPVQIGTFTVWQVSGIPAGPMGGLHYYVEFNDQVILFVGGPYYNIEGQDRNIEINSQAEKVRQIMDTMVSTLASD